MVAMAVYSGESAFGDKKEKGRGRNRGDTHQL